MNPGLDTLLVVDRAAAENNDDTLNDIYAKLCTVDCIPRKKDGFVKYVASCCKTDDEKAEAVWSAIESLRTKQREEKLSFQTNIVGSTTLCYSRYLPITR